MLTVTVDCVGSGNRRTWRPLSSLYSVIPSTVRTFVAFARTGAGGGASATCFGAATAGGSVGGGVVGAGFVGVQAIASRTGRSVRGMGPRVTRDTAAGRRY